MNTPGYSDVLIGLQYGDEGKAKIIDRIADEYDVIARFNGGANAGHTVKTKRGSVALKQIPSGIFSERADLYIGSGCAVNVQKLAEEIAMVQNDLSIRLGTRLRIADQATLIQPHHIHIDGSAGDVIGTTHNGIGPAYADRCSRMDGNRLLHIRLGDYLDAPAEVLDQVMQNLAHTLGVQSSDLMVQQQIEELRKSFALIAPYIERDTLYLQNRVRKGCCVLFEGAQSYMLDVSRGTSPYVTSSNTGAGAPYVGGDLSPEFHRKTIGVAKVPMSRVGNGPFPSEFGGVESEGYCMEDGGKTHTREQEQSLDAASLLQSDDPFEVGIALRKLSGEYGTGTGRPRRIGALDLVQLRYSIRVNGVNELHINKCDLLREFSRTRQGTIPIVTSYDLRGQIIDYVPGTTRAHREVRCHTEQRPAFSQNIGAARTPADLPPELIALLEEIERTVDCKIAGIGVGPNREAHVSL